MAIYAYPVKITDFNSKENNGNGFISVELYDNSTNQTLGLSTGYTPNDKESWKKAVVRTLHFIAENHAALYSCTEPNAYATALAVTVYNFKVQYGQYFDWQNKDNKEDVFDKFATTFIEWFDYFSQRTLVELAEEKYYVALSMISMNGTEYNVVVKNDVDNFHPIVRLGDITFKNNDSALCFDSMSRDNLRKNMEKDSSAEKFNIMQAYTMAYYKLYGQGTFYLL